MKAEAGPGGIRTPEGLAPLTDYESAPLDRSGTSPYNRARMLGSTETLKTVARAALRPV